MADYLSQPVVNKYYFNRMSIIADVMNYWDRIYFLSVGLKNDYVRELTGALVFWCGNHFWSLFPPIVAKWFFYHAEESFLRTKQMLSDWVRFTLRLIIYIPSSLERKQFLCVGKWWQERGAYTERTLIFNSGAVAQMGMSHTELFLVSA